MVKPQEAVDMACDSEAYPVVISDSGDNTTAGATGMNTYFLKLFLDKGDFHGKKVLISTIYDKRAYMLLKDREVGSDFDIMLGAGVDEWSQPVPIRGTIKAKGATLVCRRPDYGEHRGAGYYDQ